MDPNATLTELRILATRCLATGDGDPVPPGWAADALAALERFDALDEWLRRGGQPPRAWAR